MEHEIILNVSDLEPPEPLERVLAAIETLVPGQYLRMLHNREPFPLYTILEDAGFKYAVREGQETMFEIFIWRRNDDEATAAVRSVTGPQGNTRG
jgi:uncharacterized protein (DUF2249 family)